MSCRFLFRYNGNFFLVLSLCPCIFPRYDENFLLSHLAVQNYLVLLVSGLLALFFTVFCIYTFSGTRNVSILQSSICSLGYFSTLYTNKYGRNILSPISPSVLYSIRYVSSSFGKPYLCLKLKVLSSFNRLAMMQKNYYDPTEVYVDGSRQANWKVNVQIMMYEVFHITADIYLCSFCSEGTPTVLNGSECVRFVRYRLQGRWHNVRSIGGKIPKKETDTRWNPCSGNWN